MKYLSLFSGIGGFELGIQQAYVALTNGEEDRASEKDTSGNDAKGKGLVAKKRKSTNATHGSNGKLPYGRTYEGAPSCVGYCEIEKYATQIYQKHFTTHKNYGDITKIDAKELPDFDLIVGGFPCQSFSIAGKRGGFNDTRGTLFFEIARIIKEKQPRFLLLENVKGLLSHDQGRTFATIIAALDELGYDLQWQVLNSKNFGVPQNRERVFIVGHLRGTPRPEVFPFGENADVSHGSYESEEGSAQAEISHTIRGSSVKADQVFIQDMKEKGSKTRRGSIKDGYTGALDHNCAQSVNSIRRLTPKECERLQGFPDNWTKLGLKCSAECQCSIENEHFKSCTTEISDTQRYKCCGNAVTVNVIQAVMEKLLSLTPKE